MNIIIELAIICNITDGNNHVHSMVRKEFESNLVPVAGMKFEDSAWKEPREIQEVILNPTEGYYHVFVGDHKGDGIERCEKLLNMYVSHDWKRL